MRRLQLSGESDAARPHTEGRLCSTLKYIEHIKYDDDDDDDDEVDDDDELRVW